ncbi:MAG: hypothetical protein PQ612_04930 [Rickettsiales bacterium]|nr:hypothetical protein [Pseudomonadota bacterium]MDA0966363.1 hypothetical protein [Pseudomonadota bacterium]MDG4543996.1 hypothetical protein [Rickettsiales bacterium]MDG4545490.1 hypothetical protein [Rickettsiales bacterium]MDG4547939.1 hypothetical protein [Rickettsiales bacterium]
MDYIQILSAAGIVGSLLTTLVQAWITNRQHLNNRAFQEKKEAYVGFFGSIAKVNSTPEEAVCAGLWAARVNIVAPEKIRKIILSYQGAPKDQRGKVVKKLEEAIRQDLGVEN